MMMTVDPWNDLTPPLTHAAVNARRVNAEMPWGFFWARGVDRSCLLLLRHAVEASPQMRMPHLKGIETTITDGEGGCSRSLILRLVDTEQRDIFYRLCLDIMACAASAASETEAVSITLARMWRWHHLLRGGGDGRLSPEEQKGLIGELLLLDRFLSRMSALDAVSAWRGPLGAPKDFEIGRIAVEAKARRGAAMPHVTISSEHQLDTTGVDALFLHVVELDKAQTDALGSFSLSDIARRMHLAIRTDDYLAADLFESLLFAGGFSWDDEYADLKWVRGSDRLYRVGEGFPSVTPAKFPTGVLNVRYAISLHECESFRVPFEALSIALSGETDVD